MAPSSENAPLLRIMTPTMPGTRTSSISFPGPAGKTFEYTLRGDPHEPSGGEWTGASRGGRFARPGRIWYPEPLARNAERELVAPGLDYQTLSNILAGSDGSPVATYPQP